MPLAVWILEGFMSGVPREIDETAYLDGYSFPRFFVKIFVPLIGSGIGVTAFFCFMFSWVELLLARTLTTVNAKPIAATIGWRAATRSRRTFGSRTVTSREGVVRGGRRVLGRGPRPIPPSPPMASTVRRRPASTRRARRAARGGWAWT